MAASSLLSYITSSTLGDGNWKGGRHAYILHWQDQIRKYHDLSPQNTLLPQIHCTMLENVVHPIMELRQVKMQAAQFEIQSGKALTYNEYCNLLLSAAQQYDVQISFKAARFPK